MRQMIAILTQPNRSPRLHALRMPALVVHGLADKMVHVSGGRATAAAIPGAELLLIDGMGHDLPAGPLRDLRRRRSGVRRTAPGLTRRVGVTLSERRPDPGTRASADAVRAGRAQSERRAPVSVSKTCTFCGSVVT